MSSPRRSRRGRADNKGRDRSAEGGFVLLPWWVLKSEAWRYARPAALKVLLEIWRRHDGKNNKRIATTDADVAEAAHLNRRTVRSCLDELETVGFIVNHAQGSRAIRDSPASPALWEVCAEAPAPGIPASRAFMSWRRPSDDEREAALKARAARFRELKKGKRKRQ